MRFLNCFSLVIYSLIWIFAPSNSSEIRKLSHGGFVKGRVIDVKTFNKKVYSFYGIPFAKPPVGNLRFADPEPAQSWSDVREMLEQPNSCYQANGYSYEYNNPLLKMWLANTNKSEDCLYLNIWTTVSNATDDTLRPVIIWIYGGSFILGTITLDVYNGEFLSAKEDLVVVSVQYRLGLFGNLFIQPDKSGSINLGSGNQALKDQKMAMKWVKDNIRNFGGDPERVTLMGESAGAVSIGLHWLSPKSKNLFKRAILQSGSPFARWSVDTKSEAHKKALVAAKSLKCFRPNDHRLRIISCLQNQSSQQIINAGQNVSNYMIKERTRAHKEYNKVYLEQTRSSYNEGISPYLSIDLKPVIDGDFLPLSPEEAFQKFRDLQKVDIKTDGEIFMGVNKNEAMFFMFFAFDMFEKSGGLKADLKNIFPESTEDPYWIVSKWFLDNQLYEPALIATVLNNYRLLSRVINPQVRNNKYTSKEIFLELEKMASAIDFICPTIKFADEITQAFNGSVPIYMYKFSHQTESLTQNLPAWVGTMHGYEIEYFFGIPFSESFQKDYYVFNDHERNLSSTMMNNLRHFVETGNPNMMDPSSISWPKYISKGSYIEFNNDSIKNDLASEECEFWNSFLPFIIKNARSAKDCSMNNEGSLRLNCTGMRNLPLTITIVIIWNVFKRVFK